MTQLSLGRFWELYLRKGFFNAKEKAYVEDTLEALTMRVPMDSMSGAQILKFGGFTGRNGHGILLHSRAMKAEGGADLDGDKSFIFFGGEGGMRTEWKEAYKGNKEEFYSRPKKGDSTIADNKEGIILTF